MIAAEPRPHLRAVADVLLDLSLDIEMLGTTLCANPAVVREHMQELQAIDMIAQMQRSLAALLQADCPQRALSEMGLETLRTRLHELIASDPGRLN